MTTAIKRRRGTTTQHNSFTGLDGELSVDTTKKTVVVHDGSTAGGTPLAKESHIHIIANVTGLQSALDGKANASHTHVIADVTGLQTSLDAKLNVANPSFTGILYQDGLPFSGGAKGGGINSVFYENDQTVTTNYSITAGKNAMTAGPVSINNGVSVNIPNGAVWTIV